jgi:hypothetical protein
MANPPNAVSEEFVLESPMKDKGEAKVYTRTRQTRAMSNGMRKILWVEAPCASLSHGGDLL